MPFERVQKQAEIARHLPPPLYVLFVQTSAYGQACGNADASLPLLFQTTHFLFFFFRLVDFYSCGIS